jgi:perosamine synthetase
MISWAAPTLFGEEEAYVSRAIKSTMISGGEFVEQFERDFGALHGDVATAVTTSNGTTAIQLAYLAIGISPGDEIIMSGWGFLAAANMALAIGAVPVFADVRADDWLIDPVAVERLIGPKTKAIVAVHTYGNVCDVARLAEIAKSAGVAFIEDCAESLGSRRAGQLCGVFGDVATFSFQATKLITCGEGGAVLFRDPETAARARLIRNHGMEGRRRYWHHVVGHNFRLSNLHAAFLCAQFKYWPAVVEQRARLHSRYMQRLAQVPGVSAQVFAPDVDPVVWAVAIRLDNHTAAQRDAIMDWMLEQGIECRPGFYAPSSQPIYGTGPIGRSEAIADQVIVPPIQGTLQDDQIDYICDRLLARIGIAETA